jgi:5-carboxymethyl-2-hydroxymuconate isomerase
VKLAAFELGGGSHVGALENGRVLDLTDLAGGDGGRAATAADLLPRLDAVRDALERRRGATEGWHDVATVRLLAPARPGKIVAIGLNYRDHALEQDQEIPTAPLIFAKFPSAVIGPGDAIERPPFVEQLDYEAELAVVIGRRARNVDAATALEHVAAYTCLNDVSARDLQFSDKQWVRGKSLDTFAPLGPVLVTADELGDAGALRIRCIVDGEVLQDATTADLIFNVAALVSYCSRMFTLNPGDIIATGTPPGVGAFRTPPRFLQPGERVTVDIEGVGALSNPVVGVR